MIPLTSKLIQISVLCASVTAHITDFIIIPGLKLPAASQLHSHLLHIDTFTDFLYANLYVGIFYYTLYLGLGSLLESSHPAPKNEYRKRMTRKEVALGLSALFWVVVFVTVWMWKVEQHGPFYGYYGRHDFGLLDFVVSLAVYLFVISVGSYMILFDVWFFCTHLAMHHPLFWHYIHSYHHEFLEPSAFGQDAVHPLEALLQGPCGHFLLTLVFPFHPVCHAVFGFLTGLYAIFAHDGRWDYNEHNKHHYYVSCNYGLFGLQDYLWGTRYDKANYPVDYVPSWIQQLQVSGSSSK